MSPGLPSPLLLIRNRKQFEMIVLLRQKKKRLNAMHSIQYACKCKLGAQFPVYDHTEIEFLEVINQ